MRHGVRHGRSLLRTGETQALSFDIPTIAVSQIRFSGLDTSLFYVGAHEDFDSAISTATLQIRPPSTSSLVPDCLHGLNTPTAHRPHDCTVSTD